MDNHPQPTTVRAKIVRTVWNLLPAVVLLVLILTVVLLGLKISSEKTALAAVKSAALKPERPAVNVVVQELKTSVIRDRINLPGVFAPWIDLKILSQIHGAIVEVPVTVGQVVKQGAILAKVDPRDYQIAIDAAEASYKLAKTALERNRLLFAKNLLSPADLEGSETLLATRKSALENSRLQLERCLIQAPFDGIIDQLEGKEGLLLNVGDVVGRMVKIDRLKAVVGIPESDIAAIRNLAEVNLTIQALNNRIVTGKNHFLASTPENFARLYRFELAVENPGGEILPGMFLRAELIKKEFPEALGVPLYAVISRGDEQFVFIEKDGVALKRPVTTGILDGWQIQITTGLAPEDRVIIVGHRNLEEGHQVAVIKTVTDPGELLP